MDTLDWERLLCDRRLRLDAEGRLAWYRSQETEPRTPAEADVQRIIFSAPFRRLAGKTQVYPFARFGALHNRLTHSLETAEVGSGLAEAVFRRLSLPEATRRAAVLHVRAACLGHDIGNPPFGHVGEEELRRWAVRRRADLLEFLRSGPDAPEEILADWERFDGNAQAFRLLAHPRPAGTAWFRLTCATLGAFVKYPCRANPSGKFGCFATAEPCFRRVMRALGLEDAPGAWRRHPLSYITEIADDICYCVTDCEDAVTLGILEAGVVQEWLVRLLERPSEGLSPAAPLSLFRTVAIGDLMRCFARDLADAFRKPERLPELAQRSAAWLRLARLKRDYSVVFDDRRKRRIEQTACASLRRTLDAFLAALKTLGGERVSPEAQATFGEAFVVANRNQTPAWWLHALFDAVIAMTDAELYAFAERL